MIDVFCGCATPRKLPESAAGKRFKCPGCSKIIQIVSGEKLPDGSGAGDFDTALEVAGGPELGVARLLLGGVADINIGKLADRHIVLNGIKVSRAHCRLQRVDFGPSRWKIIDNKSTNGLFVNGQRVLEHDLQVGDVIGIGEYQLKFVSVLPEEEPIVLEEADALGSARTSGRPGMSYNALAATDYPYPGADGPLSANAPAPDCPSCGRTLNRAAKICIDCGINVRSGRPVLTSQGVDEEEFHEAAKRWIRRLSFFMWLTPVPIPIRSEAFGTRKPYAIWIITVITVLASISFFIYQNSDLVPPGNELMLWPTTASAEPKPINFNRVQQIANDLSDRQREKLHARYNDTDEKLSDEEVVSRLLTEINASRGHFHFYQLITHAFLHDTTSIYGFIMHLGGNMLFLLVFGTRVNALIGDLATAILYPILAVAAAGAQLLAGGDVPLLGASGAIMGLAGMYLILFPAHRVFCAMWIAMWFWLRRLFCFCKIFRVRGFLILLFYFGYDIVANLLTSKSEGGGVAHLAHIGGFSTGMVLGFAILFSRLWNTRGGDVLSVTLGKYAWPLIGKPSRWIESQAPLPRAVSLTYR